MIRLTDRAFDFQLVRPAAVAKALKRKELQHMSVTNNDPFLEKYHIEFPEPSSLAVLHAEPVSLIRGQGYTFSAEALEIIHELVAPSELSGGQYNEWISAEDGPMHHRILFFLDRGYRMAHHIFAIRNSMDEIAMTSYLGPKSHAYVAENPPPVGLLYVDDVETHTDLAGQSPFMGLLLPIADGPPDDAIWAYFLCKAEQQEIEDDEDVKVPIKKGIQRLMVAGLTGDQT
jgi:hypothetical protein